MINASNSRLAKLEASFSKMQKSTQREKNKLKQALKKLEANQKKQEKEFYVERVNERKEFVWQLLKQLGYTFDDICIIGGSLALLKEKIDSGNAADEINPIWILASPRALFTASAKSQAISFTFFE